MSEQPTLFQSELASSDVTGEWGPPLQVFICPPGPADPDPCDCGFVGEWERRAVWVWVDHPGHRRGDKAIRRDLARGFPARAGEEGWWALGGFDERCPGCGDIERFDEEGHRVAQFVERAKVVVAIDAWKAARR